MRLSDHDASFLYGETASGPMHGAVLTVLDGEITHREYTDFIASRIHLAPRLRERLAFVPMNIAHPKWVPDPEFDLANHVVAHRVPEGTTMDDAMDIALELCEPLLDRSRPLWKTYVLEGISGCTVLVQMTHHAMMDGASMVDLSKVLMDFEPDAAPPGPANEFWDPPPMPTPAELWAEAMAENLNTLSPAPPPSPDQQRLLVRANEIMQRFVTEPVITAPWNAGTVGPKRIHQWIERPFDEVRQLRGALGGTVNDIVLAVVSEAAARYLERHREAVDGAHLRLMCPVDVRTDADQGELGNRVSAMYPTLPAWSMSMQERLSCVCEETTRLKANREAEALDLQLSLAPGIPAAAMSQTLLVGTPFDPSALAAQVALPTARDVRPRPPLIGFNFTCTNVPGVPVPQYVAGRKMVRNMGTLMLGGTLGYGVGVATYDGKIIFNLTADPRLLPDLDVMRECVERSLGELAELAQTKGVSA